MSEGVRDYAHIPYRFAQTADGLPLDSRIRRAYRQAPLDAEARGAEDSLPNPFDPSEAATFAGWLMEAPRGPSRVSRYLQALYDESPHLRQQFPDLTDANAEQYLEWVRQGAGRASVPRRLIPDSSQSKGQARAGMRLGLTWITDGVRASVRRRAKHRE